MRRRGGWSAGGLPPTGPARYDLLGSGLRWIEPRRCDSNCAPAGFDTRSAYGLPCRVECEKRLSMSTGCERSNTPRCKPAARARWPRPASGQPAARARRRAEARASLRRKPAGRRRLVRACGSSAQPEGVWVKQRCIRTSLARVFGVPRARTLGIMSRGRRARAQVVRRRDLRRRPCASFEREAREGRSSRSGGPCGLK